MSRPVAFDADPSSRLRLSVDSDLRTRRCDPANRWRRGESNPRCGGAIAVCSQLYHVPIGQPLLVHSGGCTRMRDRRDRRYPRSRGTRHPIGTSGPDGTRTRILPLARRTFFHYYYRPVGSGIHSSIVVDRPPMTQPLMGSPRSRLGRDCGARKLGPPGVAPGAVRRSAERCDAFARSSSYLLRRLAPGC